MSLGRTFASNPGVTGPEPVPGQYGVSEIVLRGWICPLLVPDFLPPCLAAGLIGHRASKVDLRPDVGDVPTCEIGELLGTPHRSVSARTDTAPVSLTLLKRAMLEGIHVAWRSALTFQSCHAHSPLEPYDGRDGSDGIFSIYSGCLIAVSFLPK